MLSYFSLVKESNMVWSKHFVYCSQHEYQLKRTVIVNKLHYITLFQSNWPLRALYNTRQHLPPIHTHMRSYTGGRSYQARHDLLIRGDKHSHMHSHPDGANTRSNATSVRRGSHCGSDMTPWGGVLWCLTPRRLSRWHPHYSQDPVFFY